jgi:hypothetical protein
MADSSELPMSYDSAVASMFALGHELAQTPSNKFDLAHMRVLLKALGHPERTFPAVLIAGTNSAGFRIEDGALHVSPSHTDQ